jgi:hypothetical protein
LDAMQVDAKNRFEYGDACGAEIAAAAQLAESASATAAEREAASRAHCRCMSREARADYYDKWHHFRVTYEYREEMYSANASLARLFDSAPWLGKQQQQQQQGDKDFPATPFAYVANVGFHAFHMATANEAAAFRGQGLTDAHWKRYEREANAFFAEAQRAPPAPCMLWRSINSVDDARSKRLAAAPFEALNRYTLPLARAAHLNVLDVRQMRGPSADGFHYDDAVPFVTRMLLYTVCSLCSHEN